MTEKRDRWNAVCTAVIFAAFAVGVIEALFILAAAAPLVLAGMTYFWAVAMGGSVAIQGLEWGTFLAVVAKHLAILGACVVAFLAAGYGARRTAMPTH
ncbi:hypothetical protein GS481_02865 [Rhodococcus hoagii]|nr:hypothetical protein [Prescottella equi]